MPIKLSSIKKSDTAITALADVFRDLHAGNAGGVPLRRVVYDGQTNNIAWNMLMAYIAGENTAWLKKKVPLINRKKLNVDLERTKELFEQIFEIDLSPADIQNLAPNHPYWILHEINEQLTSADAPNRKNLDKAITNLLTPLCQKISDMAGSGLQIFEAAELINIDEENNLITIEQKKGDELEELDLPANGFVIDDSNRLIYQDLDAPPLHPLLSVDEVQKKELATKMHKLMHTTAIYRDAIISSLDDFIKEPNPEADELFVRVQKNRPKIPDADRLKVSVIGLGPGGAFAAIRAYQNGAKVTGIEKRNGYSRNNVFRLTPEIKDALVGLYVDTPEMLAALSNEHPLKVMINCKSLTAKRGSPLGDWYGLSTKDFEYLANTWLDVMAERDPDGMTVLRGQTYVPESLNKGAKTISVRIYDRKNLTPVQQPKDISVPTDILVGSDGYGSQCRKDCKIDVIKMSEKPIFYSTVTYHTEREDAGDYFASILEAYKRERTDFDLDALKAMGWQKDNPPIARYFDTGDHPYLGIEVPDAITDAYGDFNEAIRMANANKDYEAVRALKADRTQLVDDWGRANLLMFLPKAEVDKLIPKEMSLFDTVLQRASDSIHRTGAGMDVVLIGDALQSAHFQTGQGAITAVAEAEDFGQLIKSIVVSKKSKDAALSDFQHAVRVRTLALHNLAFNFPSGEDLKVRPTKEYKQHEKSTRLAQIDRGDRSIKIRDSEEATKKATVNVTRKRR